MKDKRKLSDRQERILEYIKKTILEKGYPPTVREIGEEVGLNSPSSVHGQMEALENKGYIRRDPTKPRSIEIMDDCYSLTKREVVNVPVLSNITSEQSLYDEECIESYYPIPSELLPNAETFMFKIHDDSMKKAKILKDDQVIIERLTDAENGNIIAAIVDDSVIVRRYFKEGGLYRLQSESESGSTEIIFASQVKILGRVIGLFREGIHN
ncbi:repressor LexA [Lacrimispora amygdalina]|uniref:Repressor LexA n=1 Tax=Lacrimispora amygdalina TaxID=253257 RepID=A0A3E2N4N9_9FIRM|nr:MULTISPECIES: transcriptional repressor LexA [Clostridia]RFZ75955.1 repressor LexA [Clostridium indicum]